jgi:hypothetical protein
MPALALNGTKIKVTPYDGIQIVKAPGVSEFLDDPSPFYVRVDGKLHEGGQLIGVFGPVVGGHSRYQGLVATLLLRLENSEWHHDNRSAANFKVGSSVARPNGKYPFYHPDGTDIEGFPFIIRYASLDARDNEETEINAAMENSSCKQ